MNVLYLSYDGMTDPLGQSQVIPYLAGLSAAGHQITLVSFEKKDRYFSHKDHIAGLLKHHKIQWEPLPYTKRPPVISTLWDLLRLRFKVNRLIKQQSFQVIHCRSYITSLIGLRLKKKNGFRFIFDMRGFWADERVDGNLWNLKNRFYKLMYDYFKRKEKEFISNADQIISLTENSSRIISDWELTKISVQVIPCCADLDHFYSKNINTEKKIHWKNKLGIEDNDFVLGYLGAIGTWYMLDEMLDFFKCLLIKKPSSKFLFITQEPVEMIHKAVSKKNISSSRILIASSSRNDLPSLLSLLNLSIFFIRPTFSKKASSPTKQGEIMGMGIPIICNTGIGDTDKIIESSHAGVVIKNFSDDEYMNAIDKASALLETGTETIRAGAEKYYSLTSGIELYKKVYERLELKN
jgi:glycosyltransferase involved in cell wall biosynthesis